MSVEQVFQNQTEEAMQQDLKTMDPWTVIVEAAQAMGIEIMKKTCYNTYEFKLGE